MPSNECVKCKVYRRNFALLLIHCNLLWQQIGGCTLRPRSSGICWVERIPAYHLSPFLSVSIIAHILFWYHACKLLLLPKLLLEFSRIEVTYDKSLLVLSVDGNHHWMGAHAPHWQRLSVQGWRHSYTWTWILLMMFLILDFTKGNWGSVLSWRNFISFCYVSWFGIVDRCLSHHGTLEHVHARISYGWPIWKVVRWCTSNNGILALHD